MKWVIDREPASPFWKDMLLHSEANCAIVFKDKNNKKTQKKVVNILF